MPSNLHIFTEYFLCVIKYLTLSKSLLAFNIVKCLCPLYYVVKQPLFCIFISFLLIPCNNSLCPLVEGVGLRITWRKTNEMNMLTSLQNTWLPNKYF